MQLDKLIENTINNYLNENIALEDFGEYPMPTMQDLESDTMTTLYRVAFKNQLESLFKYGYDREFTGTKGGNMYGAGVYCTNSLADSINNVKTKPEYGDCIVKMYLIGGYDKFIIFSEHMAKRQYGNNWRIEDQIRQIIKNPRDAERVIDTIQDACQRSGCNPYHGRTAPIAHVMTRNYMTILKDYGVRGIIYKGNRDGHCSLPYDFSAVIPFSVSFDQGRTFKKMFNDDTYKRMTQSCDVEFRYHGKYDKVWKPVDGYALAMKNNKFNYIKIETDEEISPYWFDYATMIDANYKQFNIEFNGITLLANVEGVLNADEEHWFKFDKLPQMTELIKQRRAARGIK